MLIRPNETMITGTIRDIQPAEDGIGGEVKIEIHSNDSPNPQKDFLRLSSGNLVTVFTSNPAKLQVGSTVQATLELAAGPFSQRTVLRNASAVSPTA